MLDEVEVEGLMVSVNEQQDIATRHFPRGNGYFSLIDEPGTAFRIVIFDRYFCPSTGAFRIDNNDPEWYEQNEKPLVEVKEIQVQCIYKDHDGAIYRHRTENKTQFISYFIHDGVKYVTNEEYHVDNIEHRTDGPAIRTKYTAYDDFEDTYYIQGKDVSSELEGCPYEVGSIEMNMLLTLGFEQGQQI